MLLKNFLLQAEPAVRTAEDIRMELYCVVGILVLCIAVLVGTAIYKIQKNKKEK